MSEYCHYEPLTGDAPHWQIRTDLNQKTSADETPIAPHICDQHPTPTPTLRPTMPPSIMLVPTETPTLMPTATPTPEVIEDTPVPVEEATPTPEATPEAAETPEVPAFIPPVQEPGYVPWGK